MRSIFAIVAIFALLGQTEALKIRVRDEEEAAAVETAESGAEAPAGGDAEFAKNQLKAFGEKLGVDTSDIMTLESNEAISNAIIAKATEMGKTEEEIGAALGGA